MNSTEHSSRSAKMPVPTNPISSNGKPTDGQVADAMRDLETEIYDVVNMAAICSDLAERLLGLPEDVKGESVTYRFRAHERDIFLFAMNDVERRINALKANYLRAWDGEAAQ